LSGPARSGGRRPPGEVRQLAPATA